MYPRMRCARHECAGSAGRERTGADGLYGTLPAAADTLACKQIAKSNTSHRRPTECTGLTHPMHRAG